MNYDFPYSVFYLQTPRGLIDGRWTVSELAMLAERMDDAERAASTVKPADYFGGDWRPLADVLAGQELPRAIPPQQRVRMNGQPEDPEPEAAPQMSGGQIVGVWLIVGGLVMLGATLLMETGVNGIHNLSRAHWQTMLLILSLAVLGLGVFLVSRRKG